MARPKKNNPPAPAKTAPEKDAADELDDLDADLEEGEEGEEKPAEEPEEPAEPAVRTRKQALKEAEEEAKRDKKVVATKTGPAVTPTDDFVRDKKGNIRLDEDEEEMRYAPGPHRQAGFVNSNGVRFPPGFKFKGGHVGTFGNVILNKCPRCGYSQSVDEARQGRCHNSKAGEDKTPCGFDKVAELDEVELDE